MAQRFEGKSLEDALNSAAQTFGVERYQLTYHVLMEKRGFLGGMKRIVIEAEINQTAPEQVAAAAAAPAPRGPREDRPSRGGRRTSGRGEGAGEQRGRGERRNRHRQNDDRRDDELPTAFVEEPAPEQTPESEAATAVREWCERVIALARLELQVRTEEREEQVIVRLYGRDARRMIEHHGEVIDALQVLANKALVGRKLEKDIELDCQQFKGKRVEELEQKAREVAERVRRDGREQLLPAMTPIERRIIHLALQNHEEVVTESRGEGFYKRVAIKPRSAASPQEQTSTAS
jgi:spoIIIJ-associated protein